MVSANRDAVDGFRTDLIRARGANAAFDPAQPACRQAFSDPVPALWTEMVGG